MAVSVSNLSSLQSVVLATYQASHLFEHVATLVRPFPFCGSVNGGSERPGDLSKVAMGRTAEIPESIFPAVVRSKHTWCAIRVFISRPRVVLRRCLPGPSPRLLRRGRRTCSFCCALPHVPLASLVPGKTSPHHEDIQTARERPVRRGPGVCSRQLALAGQPRERPPGRKSLRRLQPPERPQARPSPSHQS